MQPGCGLRLTGPHRRGTHSRARPRSCVMEFRNDRQDRGCPEDERREFALRGCETAAPGNEIETGEGRSTPATATMDKRHEATVTATATEAAGW